MNAYTNEGPIAKEGWVFIVPGLLGTLTLFAVGWTALGALGAVLSAYFLLFFRNPHRVIPEDPKAVVSAADGRVVEVSFPEFDGFEKRPCLKISVFMSLVSVHVNRFPVAGTVVKALHTPGRFLNAAVPEASTENERNAIAIRSDSGETLVLAQVAGLVARRIVSHAAPGTRWGKGARFGLIRFGSRCDLYLPASCTPLVKVGDKVSGGCTVLARFS